MSATISLTETAIFTALGAVLATFGLTSSTPGQSVSIVRGQNNRTPEPIETDFIVLWPVLRGRLATNIHVYTDVEIIGSITNNVLTITEVVTPAPTPGQTVYPVGCQILAQLSGSPGGTGTYSVTPTANVASTTLYCGTDEITQKTEVTIQADVHGPSSADNTQRISTLFRDQFAVDAFQAVSPELAPLYTSDPHQMPFENGEQQTEERWVIGLVMQANMIITVTQQFADQLKATAETVQATFPA